MTRQVTLKAAAVLVAGSAVTSISTAAESVSSEIRLGILKRAQVWMPVDIRSRDLKAGPQGPDAFAPEQVVTCEYVDKRLPGNSPKFSCRIGDDELKVKYGATNGEAYAGVAASRLLWALGFGADRVYPVQVICRNCPDSLPGAQPSDGHALKFDIAAVERKMGGREIEGPGDFEGWAWPELDAVDPVVGGAPRAHRDALKLMAALLQHTDNKPGQQRLVCLDEEKKHQKKENGAPAKKDGLHCEEPFMYLHDVGLTFGESHWLNQNEIGSTNYNRWVKAPVWRDRDQCVANVHASITGTLEHPKVSEEGRAFLAGLLAQLSDAQLHDLFEVSRFARRGVVDEGHTSNGTVDQWVAAFKKKRDEIANTRC
jgi:hypothetical protein